MKLFVAPSVGFLLYLFFSIHSVEAQQTTLSLFHWYNWQSVNPAAIDRMQMFGEHQTLLNASFRQQWVGFEGSPIYYHLSFEHMPAVNSDFPHKIKWGFSAFKDQAGAIGTYGISGNFSGYINLGYKKFLHGGINIGLVRYQISTDDIKFKEEDPLPGAYLNQLYTDVSLGLFYRQTSGYRADRKGFYTGISVPQTFVLNIGDQEQGSGLLVKERISHLYALAGGFITPNSRGRFTFEPSIWLRYVPGVNFDTMFNNFPISANANIRSYYFYDSGTSNSFWFGLGYGTNQNLKIEFGINKVTSQIFGDPNGDGMWRIGMGWELPLSSHRINLGHTIDINITYAWD